MVSDLAWKYSFPSLCILEKDPSVALNEARSTLRLLLLQSKNRVNQAGQIGKEMFDEAILEKRQVFRDGKNYAFFDVVQLSVNEARREKWSREMRITSNLRFEKFFR